MRRLWIASLFIVLVFLAGCGGGSQSPEPYTPLGTITDEVSSDWGTLNGGGVSEGCIVINNVWNKVHAPAGPSYQSVFLEDINGETAFGWSWQWPTGTSVVTYPEVVYGTKPWDIGDGPYAPGGQTPFKAGTKKVTANFNIRTQATGTYNMAFSLWATASTTTPKASISHEIMIWNANHGLMPAGTKQGELTVGGTVFDVYVNPNHVDNSGGATITWTYIAFAARQPILNGSLELSAFIDYLLDPVNEGLMANDLTGEHYITSIELGNEVVCGSGMTEIRNYSVVLEEMIP